MAEIEFRGYSADCVIHGRLAVPDDVRLTDFLNATDAYGVTDTSLYALDDGRPVAGGEQQLTPDDLWAVEPTDSKARADLHVPTRQVAVVIDVPPYHVTGFLHGVNTGDPLATVSRRRRMIPLTEAVIRFSYAGQQISREVRSGTGRRGDACRLPDDPSSRDRSTLRRGQQPHRRSQC